MIRESFKFRKRIGADTILTSGYKLPEVYTKYPLSIYLGFDKENCVARYIMGGICDFKGFVSSLRIVDLMKILVYFLEHDLEMIREKKKITGKLDEKSTYIIDLNGFNFKQFYHKSVINAGIKLITMYQDNYPETLKTAYIINVPSYFSWVFSFFKPFLNSVTLSKIKIFKADEWQDEIFSILDKKQIPAFMGGELTDSDGDPKCSSLINWDCKIPTSYYLKQNRKGVGEDDNSSMKAVTIQKRSSLEVPIDVQTVGSVLKWVFRTEEYNIKFGFFYKDKQSHTEELIPVECVDCHVIPEENEFICERTGTYILHFDNSYSWIMAKQMWYKIEVQSPDAKKPTSDL